jgi:hypothetical protein
MKKPTTARRNAQLKETILKILFGNSISNENFSDEEIILRIKMLSDFYEKVIETALDKDLETYLDSSDTTSSEKWTRWALDNIS